MTRSAPEPTGHPHRTAPPTRTKGSDRDHPQPGNQDDQPASTGYGPRRTHRERRPTKPRREWKSLPAPQRQKESYDEQRARLDAEAVDRWAVIVADWPPMTDEQIRAIAVILNRIDARLAGQRRHPQRRG